MQNPNEGHEKMLKRICRYLKRYPNAKRIFTPQVFDGKLSVYGDSDHAGCAVTRKSTTGMVASMGGHVVKRGSWIESTIALSSGESEYYALVRCSATGLGLQSMYADWNLPVEVEVLSDSSAAR